MTPPYEYVVWKQYDNSQFVLQMNNFRSMVSRAERLIAR